MLGQSLLIVTGVSYGVVKALEAFGADSPAQPAPRSAAPPNSAAAPNVDASLSNLTRLGEMLGEMEERLIRMEKSLQVLATAVEHRAPVPKREDFVSRAELNASIERLSGTLNSDIERRFEVQDRSVQSLRTMIARTDELLEQILESIESANVSS